jgi:hypothetical protein
LHSAVDAAVLTLRPRDDDPALPLTWKSVGLADRPAEPVAATAGVVWKSPALAPVRRRTSQPNRRWSLQQPKSKMTNRKMALA